MGVTGAVEKGEWGGEWCCEGGALKVYYLLTSYAVSFLTISLIIISTRWFVVITSL